MTRLRSRPASPAPGGMVVLLVAGLLSAMAACRAGDHDNLDGGLTGEPLVVGLLNQEGSPVGSFPDFRRGAEAAVAHANRDLGGVDGRPLRLHACATAGTAESSQACAAEIAGGGAVAVVGGIDLGSAASLPVLADAGIPYVGALPQLGDELTAAGAYLLAGGTVADLLGQVAFALDELGAERVGGLYMDLPGVLAAVVQAADVVLRLRGVTDVRLVAAGTDEADFTPALAAATAGDPEAVFVVFPAQACARIMRAARGLSVEAAMFYPSACAEESVVEAAGPAAEGAYFGSAYLPFDHPSPEVAAWRSRVESDGVLSQAGFSAVMNVHRLLTEVARPTADALTAALDDARDHPGYMTHPYTCDGSQLPLMRAACNPHVRILRYQDGAFRDVVGDWVDGSALVELFP